MKTVEYLSKDILEESHLKSFSPFRVIQMILGTCRVDAKNRFVTPPTKAQKLYTIFCILLTTLLYINIAVNYLTKFWAYQNIYYLNITSLIFNYATSICNIIHVRFMNNDSNVMFYIKTQEIDRSLKIDKNKIINDIVFNSNLATVVIILIISCGLFAAAITQNLLTFVSFIGMFYSQVTCTLEWLYCSNLLIFFYIRIRFINAIMRNHLEGKEEINTRNMKYTAFLRMKILRSIAAEDHDFISSETDVYLQYIFDELYRFQNLYRFQIFLFCFKFVTSTLMMFEFGLLAFQNNILDWLECIVLPTIATIDLVIIIVICIRCEAFSREIKETKYLCTTILSLYYEGPIRRKAMKMLKMIKEKPPQFSVYDMWLMDASTMINMINLVTNLMVTLLQFALL